MMFLTVALTIWMPIVLGVAVGYLVPQLLTARAALPVGQEPPDTPRN